MMNGGMPGYDDSAPQACAAFPDGSMVHNIGLAEIPGYEAEMGTCLVVVPCPDHDEPGHMFAGQQIPPASLARYGAALREEAAHQARLALGQM